MGYNVVRKPIQIDSPALASNQSTRLNLADALRQIGKIALGHTILAKIQIEVDATYTGNAADALGEDHAHNVLRGLFFRLPGVDRPVINFPTFAGGRLRKWHHFTKGRRARPINGTAGNFTPAGGGGSAARLKFEIPCYLPRAARGRDIALPLEMLRESAEIELVWANLAAGGFGGANISVVGNVVRATAVLEERPEFVVPVPFSLELFTPGVAQGTLGVSGRVLHSIMETAIQANGTGEPVIADAARDEINLTVDSLDPIERMDTRALTQHWNDEVAVVRDEEIPDPEAGTQTWLPWFHPFTAGNRVQLTKLPLCVARPGFRVTGTSTTPELIVTTFDLNDQAAAANRIERAGVAVPPDFSKETLQNYLTNKTVSKQPAQRGADGASRLPVRLHMKPIAGTPAKAA